MAILTLLIRRGDRESFCVRGKTRVGVGGGGGRQDILFIPFIYLFSFSPACVCFVCGWIQGTNFTIRDWICGERMSELIKGFGDKVTQVSVQQSTPSLFVVFERGETR